MTVADHVDVVRSVKATLGAVDPADACAMFGITSRVAWALRMESAGLLFKGGGWNCSGYATDCVIYPDGTHFDILRSDGEPQWNLVTNDDGSAYLRPGDWRPALDPGDAAPAPAPIPVPPVEPPAPVPLPDPVTAIVSLLTDIRNDQRTLVNLVKAATHQ